LAAEWRKKMKKNFKTIMTIVLLCVAMLTMLTVLTACGGSADGELVKWTESGDGKTWEDAKTQFGTDYAEAAANNDQDAAIAALNTMIDATSSAKASLEKIDRDKLNDANKGIYDQSLNTITESLSNCELSLAQYQGATGGEEVTEEE
jgi:hypothetical protein